MRSLKDLLSVARAGLLAKRGRTLLVALGPMLGVAAIVGVVGISDSARGEVRTLLRELGTELIVVSAQPSLGDPGAPRLPIEAAQRVRALDDVASVAATITVEGVTVRPSYHPGDRAAIAPYSVRGADSWLLEALRVGLDHGRFLNDADAASGARVAVLGHRIASLYGVSPGEVRTVLLDERLYAVVGVLDEVRLVPELDWAVIISPSAASRDWGHDGRPSSLYVRSVEGRAEAIAEMLPIAITFGGPGLPAVSLPSSLLAADAQIDATLRMTALGMGALSLFVGAIGIANTLTISVLQRSAEIGVRRALGHTRSLVAAQFLLEALVVGLVGGSVGAIAAIGLVAVVAAQQAWVLVIEPGAVVITTATSVAVAGVAGIYPAWRAARLDPLAALRG